MRGHAVSSSIPLTREPGGAPARCPPPGLGLRAPPRQPPAPRSGHGSHLGTSLLNSPFPQQRSQERRSLAEQNTNPNPDKKKRTATPLPCRSRSEDPAAPVPRAQPRFPHADLSPSHLCGGARLPAGRTRRPRPPPSETSPAAACGQLRPLTPGGGPGRAAVARRRIARPRGAARPPSRRAPAGLPCPPRYLRPSTALPRPPPAAPGLTEKQQQEEREQAGRPLPALPHAGGCLSLREADGGRRTRSTRLDSARLPPPGDRRPLASRCPASARSRPPAPTGRAAPRSQPQRQTFPSARPRAPPPAGSGGGAGPVRPDPAPAPRL